MRTAQPADLGTILSDFERRLQALETSPPGALRLLTSVSPVTSTSPVHISAPATGAVFPGLTTPSFTLTRPTSILVLGFGNFFKFGSTSNAFIRLKLSSGDSSPTASWPNTETSGSPNLVHKTTLYIVVTLAPGTYTAHWEGDLIGGTDNVQVGIGFLTPPEQPAAIHVFQLGG